MKADIHPTYYDKTKVTCACGATFLVGSTKEKINVEICSACHPFYTGQEKVIDTAGRVERFKQRSAASSAMAEKRKASSAKRASKKSTAK